MDKRQKYFTPFGFTAPIGKCKESSFASGAHRLALFPISYHDDNFPGYSVRQRCVNCGEWIGETYFKASKRIKEADELISI